MYGTTETVTTPVTTPTETPAAAPATSAPSSTGETSQRPTTVKDLASYMAKLDATSAAATPTDPASTQETAATGQDATTLDPTGATHPKTDKQGPIPFDVHSKALENARTKAANEAVAKYREQHGWAEQVPRETFQEWTVIAQRMSSDPIGFLSQFQAEIANHPTYGPQLRSHAARTLASGRGPQAPDLSPDLVVDDGNGRQISTFSAERVQQIVQHAINDALQKEVGPIKQTYQQRQAAQKAAEQHRALEAKADEVLADITAIVGEEDSAIAEVAKTMDANPSWSAQRAAAHVHKTVLRPQLEQKAHEKVLDHNRQKAAGNTGVGNPSAVPPKRPTTRKELAAWMAAHA